MSNLKSPELINKKRLLTEKSSFQNFYYQKKSLQIVKELGSSIQKGLTQKEAQKRIIKNGLNIINKEKKRSVILTFFSYFADIFSLLLFFAAFISWLFGGDTGFRDALIIIGIIVVNSLVGFIQEYRAEKIIEALQKVLPHKSVVLRDGKEVEVLASEIVVGDILVLDEGDDISADCRIIEENELATNDFTLTGESIPQEKFSSEINRETSLTDIDNMVFAGTSVAKGNAKVVVIATGMNTEFGKIAKITQKIQDEKSPLQKELERSGKKIAKITVVVGLFIFIINILLNNSFSYSLIFALSLAVAMVPEGLPATVSVALALAVKKMAKKKALVKKLSAVETLGSATVICTDKTGTITKNEVTAKEIWVDFKDFHIKGIGYNPEGEILAGSHQLQTISTNLKEAITAGAVCSNAKLVFPEKENEKWRVLGDPTEGAMITLAQKIGLSKKEIDLKNKRIMEIPFTSERKKMTVVVKNNNKIIVYSKGAPNEILNKCSYVKFDKINDNIKYHKDIILDKVDSFASDGLRVLAVASKEINSNKNLLDKNEIEKDLTFLGLVAMIDPPKEGVKEAILSAKKAGIKVVMITGDYGLTAASIGKRVGIVSNDYLVINGSDLIKMNDREVLEKIKDKDIIFARTTPDQKIRIVSLFQKQGEVVAVTGDGVNDAPALKKADIGIAMGIAGTDVSKEAAEVVLLDDNFRTIVSAIEEGRVIYKNLKKFVHYIFSSNVGELFAVITGLVLGIPAPLLAIQILAIDLGTDVFPSLALAVDKKEEGIMNEGPRDKSERLLNKDMIIGFFSTGVVMGIGAGLAFMFILISKGWYWGRDLSAETYIMATTVAYSSLVFSQMINVFSVHAGNKSILKNIFTNSYLVIACILSLGILSSFIYIPIFQNFLQTGPIEADGFLVSFFVAFIVLIFIKIKKYYIFHKQYL